MPVPEFCEPAKHLYIGLPAYGGTNVVETTSSLYGAAIALTLLGIESTLGVQPGCPYLWHVRNQIVTAFMQSTATDLLFWDADVGAPPEAVVQIVQARRPFICGVYPYKSDDIGFPVSFDTDTITSDADGYVVPYTVPFGFVRLNRAVFEAMPCQVYRDDAEREWMGYFDDGIRNGRTSGEDTAFAKQWQALGGKIHMIPDITFTHTGMKTWRGNWGRWLLEQAESPRTQADGIPIGSSQSG